MITRLQAESGARIQVAPGMCAAHMHCPAAWMRWGGKDYVCFC